MTDQELEAFLKRVKDGCLVESDSMLIQAMAQSLRRIRYVLQERDTTIGRLVRMIFGTKTESSRNILKGSDKSEPPESSKNEPREKGSLPPDLFRYRAPERSPSFLREETTQGKTSKICCEKEKLELPPPIQMGDALSRNLPKGFTTILANCMGHARRNFVDGLSSFPEPCRHVIEILARVYHHDEITKKRKMTAEDRLKFHQAHSGPLMEELKAWLKAPIQRHIR